MKRPYLTFISAVVLPTAVALVAATRVASGEWTEIWLASHVRIARMALASLEQEIGAGTEALAERAEPIADVDPGENAVRRALQGDTVAGLGVSGDELTLSVVLADSADPRSVRFASGSVVPATPALVGRATGYSVSLYLNGRRWRSTEPPAGPSDLGSTTLQGVASGRAVPLEGGPGGAVALALGSEAGAPPAVVAVVRPLAAPGPAVALPVLLVVGLLLLFSALAGWIQLARPAGSRTGVASARSSMVLLSCVPALTVLVFIAHLERSQHSAVTDTLARDLSRALQVAGRQHLERSPEGVRAVSGFHATLLRGGRIEGTTYGSEPTNIGALPAPPPSFSGSGTLVTPEGPAVYASSRLADGSVMVITSPLPSGGATPLQGPMTAIGAALAIWLLGVGAAAAVLGRWRERAVSSGR